MRKVLKHIISEQMADNFWDELCRDGDTLDYLSVGDFLMLFTGSKASAVPFILAAYVENYPDGYDPFILMHLRNKLRQWVADEAGFLVWGVSEDDLVINEDFYEAFVFNLGPTKRALFSARPTNAVEWQVLSNSLPLLNEQFIFDVITGDSDDEFERVIALPFFDPYAYLRGVHDYFTQINASEYLSEGQKARRIERIKQLQQASCEATGRSCLTMHMSRQPFGFVDLTGFSNAIAADDPPMAPADYVVDDVNPDIITRFFTLLRWLEAQGFVAIAEKLEANTSIRMAHTFNQTVYRLELFCANIWSTLQKPDFVETIYYEAGVEVKALKCRENFANTDIIGQMDNCAAGVEEAFMALESFLAIPFHQKIFNDVKRQQLMYFHQQYGTRPGLQVHVDEAELLRSLGLFIPEAYKTDPYRLPIATTHLQSLGQKILAMYRSSLAEQCHSVSAWLQQCRKRRSFIYDDDCSLTLLMKITQALSEIDIKMTVTELVSGITELNTEEAPDWCYGSSEKNEIMINEDLLSQLIVEVNQKFAALVCDQEIIYDDVSLQVLEQILFEILQADEDLTKTQLSVLDAVLQAPDGLYLMNGVIGAMHEIGLSVIAKNLLIPANNGNSIYMTYATTHGLAPYFVGARLHNENSRYEVRYTDTDFNALYNELKTFESVDCSVRETATEEEMKDEGGDESITVARQYHHQTEMLLTAPGAVNFWLGCLAVDGEYSSPEGLLGRLLIYFTVNDVHPYQFDNFVELLLAFMRDCPDEGALAESYLEERKRSQLAAGNYQAYLATAVLLPEQTLDQEKFDAITADDLIIENELSLQHYAQLVDGSDVSIAMQAAEKAKHWQTNLGDAATPMQSEIFSQLSEFNASGIDFEAIVSLMLSLQTVRPSKEIVEDMFQITQKLKAILSHEDCLALCDYISKQNPRRNPLHIDVLLSCLVLPEGSDRKEAIEKLISSREAFSKVHYLYDLILTITALVKVLGVESKDAIQSCITHDKVRSLINDESDFRHLCYGLANALPKYANENIILVIGFTNLLRFFEIKSFVKWALSLEHDGGVDPAVILRHIDYWEVVDTYNDLIFLVSHIASELKDESKDIFELLLDPKKMKPDIKRDFNFICVISIITKVLGSESNAIITKLLQDEVLFRNAFVDCDAGFDKVLYMIGRLPDIAGEQAAETASTLVQSAVSFGAIKSTASLVWAIKKIYFTFASSGVDVMDMLFAKACSNNLITSVEEVCGISCMLTGLFKSEAFFRIEAFVNQPEIQRLFDCAGKRKRLYNALRGKLLPPQLMHITNLLETPSVSSLGLFSEAPAVVEESPPVVEDGPLVGEGVDSPPGDAEEKPDAAPGPT
ncbi:MAG: hypothetical protein P1U40_03885 [Coxiellaceae bacterium]|nr:hypothetical protein [Coxiellaceae bacterium]